MKKILISILITTVMAVATLLPSRAIAQNNLTRGVVVYDGQNDYHIVKVGNENARYVIVKRYSGPTFSKGDVLFGNIVARFSYKELYVNSNDITTQVYVEYHYSNINTCFAWLENQGQVCQTTPVDPIVYVCTGGSATKYHSHRNCNGLNNCSNVVNEMPESRARQMGRTRCSICY